MAVNFYKAHAVDIPTELDTISSKTGVYLRKNIHRIEQEDQDGKKQYLYEYDEAYLTNDEYALYSDIDSLTMTAQDFLGFINNAGATWEEINTFLNSNAELKLRLTTCQNVFCGVVKQLVGNGIEVGGITITADMIESAFKTKYGL